MVTEQNRTEQTETQDNQGTGQRFCILVFVPQALFVPEQENRQNWGEKFLQVKIEREERTEDRQTVETVLATDPTGHLCLMSNAIKSDLFPLGLIVIREQRRPVYPYLSNAVVMTS